MTTDAVGGVWTYTSELARALCEAGEEVKIVVMGPPPRSDQISALRGICRLDLEITDLALEWMDPDGTDLGRARQCLLRIAQRMGADVVHFNSYREADFDWPVPVVVVAHSCVWSWWEACRGGTPGETRWQRYAAFVGAGLMAADAWVAPTIAFRAAIASRYPTPMQGCVIANGTDLPAPPARKEAFILAAGRLWDKAKNLAAIEDIARELDWPVLAAGPHHSPGAPVLARAGGRMIHLGVLPRAQMLARMRRASIFVSPALYEPFGLSVLEAAACGCALVLSDIPSLRELWGGAALFVQPRDRAALHQTLQELCRSSRQRRWFQNAAAARASRYSLARMAMAYRGLYHGLAGKAPVFAAPPVPMPEELSA